MLQATRARSHVATVMMASRVAMATSTTGLPSIVAITGASGLLGRALTEHLESRSVRVLKLVRRAGTSDDEVRWSPSEGFVDVDKLRGVQAVVSPRFPGKCGTEVHEHSVDACHHDVFPACRSTSPVRILGQVRLVFLGGPHPRKWKSWNRDAWAREL